MQQLLQSLNTGEIELLDVPCPATRPGHLLIQTTQSLISAGTERMLVEFGKASLLQKAREHPDRVREVLDKVRSQGLLATVEAVRSKLAESIPLGYCNVGTVVGLGDGVQAFALGDRVVSNGPHAEVVSVPQNLCARIPDSVADDDAVFTVVGAIALQGMRLAEPTLGECIVVTGLGLIGLLATQLLLSNGCRVLGVDFDHNRLELAKSLGAETVQASENVTDIAHRFSRGRGVDAVLITASTKSDEPIHQAAQMCRKRGRIVLVGATGLNLQRSDFYEKELQFRVSCSYGPGRYDPSYEQQGVDYPVGFVRWTEQRNFEAVLDQFAVKKLTAATLKTHAFPFTEAKQAYEAVMDPSKASLGVLLEYPRRPTALQADVAVTVSGQSPPSPSEVSQRSAHPVRIGMIGAGNFARRMLIPHLKKAGGEIISVASQAGLTATTAARSHGVAEATSDWKRLLDREDVDALAIATRHDTHASMTLAAIRARKHVFVEKPLALNRTELQEIDQAPREGLVIMVGYNRRFAPMVRTIKEAMDREHVPKTLIMTVNAGSLPDDHWTHDPQVGGGRILGEGCHFVDLLRHLVGHSIDRVQAAMTPCSTISSDRMSILLGFADGSVGTIHYLAHGGAAFPKERLDVFCNGQTLQLNNYRRLRSYGWQGVKNCRHWKRDQGHGAAAQAFLEAAAGQREAPIPWEEIVETTDTCFDIMDAAESGETIHRARDTATSALEMLRSA